MQETGVQSLSQEDLLEKGIATHSSILAWRIPWAEELGALQSMGLQRVGHDWASNTTITSALKYIISISEVVDISPGNLYFILQFIQPVISHEVLWTQLINRVEVYSLPILLSQFWTSPLFHVCFNCCFFTCIQVSQETGKVFWYSHLYKNFLQFIMIHTVKGFSSQWSRSKCFYGILLLSLWLNKCWQFDLWFFCLF